MSVFTPIKKSKVHHGQYIRSEDQPSGADPKPDEQPTAPEPKTSEEA